MGIKISIPIDSDVNIELRELIWQNISIKLKNLDIDAKCSIFFGDSIIGFSSIEEYLKVINLGIPGERIENAVKHITEFNSLNGKKLIFAYGINDINFGSKNNIVKNYQILIKYFSKQTKIYITSILPVNSSLAYNLKGLKINNSEIVNINQNIENICNKYSNVFFVNTAKNMYDKSYNLKKDYTTDGVHLSKQGYQLFYNNLIEYFGNYKVGVF